MEVYILLFLLIIATCQAYESPLHRPPVARKGDPDSIEHSLNDQLLEKLKESAIKYVSKAVDPDLQTLLVPDVYKPGNLRSWEPDERPPGAYVNSHLTNPIIYHQQPNPVPSCINNPGPNQQYSNLPSSRFTHPALHTRFLINESDQLRKVAQADQAQAEREARLAEIDREALSKLSDEDRQMLESQLSKVERQALLAKLEDGQLNDLLPREENRFGGFSSAIGGFSGAAAQIGASAGGYIGRKLAGTLGAKLGAAAGAYLGAAAASRFVKKSKMVSNTASDIVSDDNVTLTRNPSPSPGIQYGASYGGFGAVMVNNK